MEMPQSIERIRGRDAMRAMRESYPTPPDVRLRRVRGYGRTWVVEGINDYDGDVWSVVLILELGEDGLIVRDTRYYSQRSDPSAVAIPLGRTDRVSGGTLRGVHDDVGPVALIAARLGDS